MFSRKCQVQNDIINLKKQLCGCQNLDLALYFTIKTLIFKLRPLSRFLHLINSFYRTYVPCMYNISNISNVYIQYIIDIFNIFTYSILSIHSVIRSHMLGFFLSYFLCRISSSHGRFARSMRDLRNCRRTATSQSSHCKGAYTNYKSLCTNRVPYKQAFVGINI